MDHSQIPKKKLTNAAFGRLQAFRMYGGIGMSAPSLHRESADSLIYLISSLLFSKGSWHCTILTFHFIFRVHWLLVQIYYSNGHWFNLHATSILHTITHYMVIMTVNTDSGSQ